MIPLLRPLHLVPLTAGLQRPLLNPVLPLRLRSLVSPLPARHRPVLILHLVYRVPWVGWRKLLLPRPLKVVLPSALPPVYPGPTNLRIPFLPVGPVSEL